MGAKGPPPKDPDKRKRRNAAPQQRELAADAKVAKPPALPGARDYQPATRRWYKTWATSPQATLFTATDWQRLHMLAPIVDAYFSAPAKELLAEIRLNEERLGATLIDRQRLQLKIVDEPQDEPRRRSSARARPDPRRLAVVQ